jgi:hypothetical protein
VKLNIRVIFGIIHLLADSFALLVDGSIPTELISIQKDIFFLDRRVFNLVITQSVLRLLVIRECTTMFLLRA